MKRGWPCPLFSLPVPGVLSAGGSSTGSAGPKSAGVGGEEQRGQRCSSLQLPCSPSVLSHPAPAFDNSISSLSPRALRGSGLGWEEKRRRKKEEKTAPPSYDLHAFA